MDFVVTACHCLADISQSELGPATPRDDVTLEAYTFVAGTISLETYDSSFQIGKAQSLHWHPQCQSTTAIMNDIALAKMSSPFQVTPYVRPLKMFTWDKAEFKRRFHKIFGPRNQPKCTVAGWGEYRRGPVKGPTSSNRLRIVTMLVVSDADCQRAWTQMFPDSYKNWNFSEYGQMCAVSEKLDESDCTGDSGSPYVCNGRLIAVVSYGIRCGTEDPSVYQTISELVDWCKQSFVGQINMTERPDRYKIGRQLQTELPRQLNNMDPTKNGVENTKSDTSGNTFLNLVLLILVEKLWK